MAIVNAHAIAVGRGPVTEHDPADAVTRWRRQVDRIATPKMDDRRHLAPPQLNATVV
jgi:hypothetical protein